jgi:hypothetical protein
LATLTENVLQHYSGDLWDLHEITFLAFAGSQFASNVYRCFHRCGRLQCINDCDYAKRLGDVQWMTVGFFASQSARPMRFRETSNQLRVSKIPGTSDASRIPLIAAWLKANSSKNRLS